MKPIVQELIEFIDSSPTPYHAAASSAELLGKAGFQELDEARPFDVTPGQGYYLIRNDASLVAFRAPGGAPERTRIVGAHTDSPNLRLKPLPEFTRHGYTQLGVEVYGGALYNSWLDRDLSVAGRVFVRGDSGTLRRELVRHDSPLARIPQLAIHLDRGVNKDGVKLNAQKHLAPMIGLAESDGKDTTRRLMERLARDASFNADDVTGFDLCLYPTEPSSVSGLDGEFLHAPRLDNLAMCHAALRALTGATPEPGTLAAVALFDNEEIGSDTAQGAGSPLLGDVLERAWHALGQDREAYLRGRASSLFLSADMAHAIHPNYPDRHDDNHRPRINAGPVIKYNANQRYATDGSSSALLEEICRARDIPYQKFVNRSDLGSTIGPITASNLGIAVVDAGNAMLSMHSAREMAGTQDPEHMERLMGAFLAG